MNVNIEGSGLAARKMPHEGQYDSMSFEEPLSSNEVGDMRPAPGGCELGLDNASGNIALQG
jgi:hypothetical protein